MSTLPRKVIYIDQITTWYPDPLLNVREAATAGYNVIILAFYLLDKATDIVYAFTNVANEQQRKDTLDYIHSKGGILLMSAGGDSIAPYEQISGTEYGTRTATFAKQYGFDGVDYDLEGFGPGLTYGSLNSEQIIDWLSDCVTACKNVLGDKGIISTAPQSPYFSPIGIEGTWAGVLGGFVGVNAKVGDKIDFYNVQFYNQGSDMYVNYQNLFVNSGTSLPFTSVKQIFEAGIPLNKIVVGKPMFASDASTGFVNLSQLGLWFKQAEQELNWNAGVMFWQWHDYTTAKQALDQVYPTLATEEKIVYLKCKLRKNGRLLCEVIKN
jgi:chitinase